MPRAFRAKAQARSTSTENQLEVDFPDARGQPTLTTLRSSKNVLLKFWESNRQV